MFQTEKELIQLPSKLFAEAVYVDRPEKDIICFSTQLNCSVGCKFCASPNKKKPINLTFDDLIYQVNYMKDKYCDSSKQLLLSFMGEGEPLLNFDNVIESIRYFENNFKNTKIAISTSGASTKNIKRLADIEFNIPTKLQVTIHIIKKHSREWLMPHAKSIDEIKEALEYYKSKQPSRSLELNFTLIEGINDSIHDARDVALNFPNYYIKINRFNRVDGKLLRQHHTYELKDL